jgi:HK97 family phage portal protein
MPWLALVEHWMMSLLHRGNAYAFKLRNDVGQVTGLRAIHPDRVRVGQASDGTKVFKIDNQEIGYTSREILHIPGLSYNGVVGIDPFAVMAEGLGRAVAADQFASKSFGTGFAPSGVHLVPRRPHHRAVPTRSNGGSGSIPGVGNGEQFGVLGNGAEYKTVTLTPEQQQLIETRKFEVTEIARYLGVVPHKLYDLERATFSNIEQQAIEAVVDGIRPGWSGSRRSSTSTRICCPAGNFIEFDLEGLLRGDSAARGAFYTALINAGVMTPYTAAKKENLPAPEELKYYLRPLNMAVIREGQPDLIQPAENETITVSEVPA